jgi:hypothetical protein
MFIDRLVLLRTNAALLAHAVHSASPDQYGIAQAGVKIHYKHTQEYTYHAALMTAVTTSA